MIQTSQRFISNSNRHWIFRGLYWHLAPGLLGCVHCPLFPHSRAESVWAESLHAAPGLDPASARHRQLVAVVTQTISSYSHSMITTGIQRISSFNTDCCGYFGFNSYRSLFALKFYKVHHCPNTLSVSNHPLISAKSLTWLERKLNLNEIAHFHINWKDLNVWEASVSACYLPRCFRMARGRGPIGSLEFYWIKLETLVFGQQGFVWVIWSWQLLSPWDLHLENLLSSGVWFVTVLWLLLKIPFQFIG